MKKKALEDELDDLEGKLQRAEKLLSGAACHDAVCSCAPICPITTHWGYDSLTVEQFCLGLESGDWPRERHLYRPGSLDAAC